jgi:hypothetical protein
VSFEKRSRSWRERARGSAWDLMSWRGCRSPVAAIVPLPVASTSLEDPFDHHRGIHFFPRTDLAPPFYSRYTSTMTSVFRILFEPHRHPPGSCLFWLAVLYSVRARAPFCPASPPLSLSLSLSLSLVSALALSSLGLVSGSSLLPLWERDDDDARRDPTNKLHLTTLALLATGVTRRSNHTHTHTHTHKIASSTSFLETPQPPQPPDRNTPQGVLFFSFRRLDHHHHPSRSR